MVKQVVGADINLYGIVSNIDLDTLKTILH